MGQYTGTEQNDVLTGDFVNAYVSGTTADGLPIITVVEDYGDTISGLGGNDTLNGGYGSDNLSGGDGDDVLHGFGKSNYPDGSFTVYFGDQLVFTNNGSRFADDDRLDGGAGDDILYGDGGNDTLDGGYGYDQLYGGEGNDTLGSYSDGGSSGTPDILDGGAGDDEVMLYTAGDTIRADIRGGAGIDTINFINAAFDGFSAALGFERLGAGFVSNTAYGTAAANILDFSCLVSTARNDGQGVWINGLGGNDVVTGTAFADRLEGGDGDDVLDGGAGNDRLSGGYGADILYGRDGDDMLQAAGGGSMLYGGDGNDTLGSYWDAGSSGIPDIIDGGAGDDEVLLDGYGAVVRATLQGGAGVDTINFSGAAFDGFSAALGFERVGAQFMFNAGYGTAAANILDFSSLVSTARDDGLGVQIDALGGNDVVTGTAFVDRLDGGDGDDVLDGGAGNDRLSGGIGADILHGRVGDDLLQTSGSGSKLYGDEGNDTLQARGGGSELHGGEGNDTLSSYQDPGSSGIPDVIDGGAGDDDVLLEGYALNVSADLQGGAGTDSISFINAVFASFSSELGFERLGAGFAFGSSGYGTAGANILDFSCLVSNARDDGAGVQINGLEGDDVITGTAFVDHLDGGDGNDLLDGGAGNDWLSGGTGTDVLHGRNGDDILQASGGGSTLDGGEGNDMLSIYEDAGSSGVPDIIDGGAGDDEVVLSGYGVTVRTDLHGGTGTDTISFINAEFESFSAAQGFERLGAHFIYNSAFGTAAANVLDFSCLVSTARDDGAGVEINGLGGNDLITGTAFADRLDGGDGDDVLVGGIGADTLAGGAGNDTASYAAETATITVLLDSNLAAGGGASGDRFTGIENVTGGGGDDLIRGDANDNVLDGGAGTDQLYGGLGNDIFHTDRQADVVFESAGEGTDTVITTASYYLYANIENLTLAAGAGNIFGVGNELANTITGNEGSNTLLAGAGNDMVHGGAGVDILYGEDGNDQLFGDADNDVIVGGAGNDVIDGGAGGDLLYGEDGNDTLWGGTDFVFDQLVGGAGNDILHGDSGLGDFDYLIGNTGDDSYYVDTYADLVFENAAEGTDTVYASTAAGSGYYLYANIENLVLTGQTFYGVGNELANTMTGSALDNWLLGGAGNDILNGKAGNDVLFGQDGADTFVFEHGTGGDTIADFTAGTDKIDLTAFGFTSFAQVQAAMSENGGSSAIILGNGDLIVLQNVTNAQLHAGDFILASAKVAPDDGDDLAAAVHAFSPELWHSARIAAADLF